MAIKDPFRPNWTQLHWAAFRCQKEEVQRLLSEGADPNATDQEGWTPIVCAVFGDIQTFGLQFGSKKDRAAYRQRHGECREILEFLIGSGADVNAKTIGGVTTLGACQLMGSAEFAALIRRHGGK
jgi:ankyrin repeat protein